MGIESRKAPPLPAPTEDSSVTPTELTTLDDQQSRLADEASHYSLPDDGTPVTIRTRGHKANRSQTSLLIEYFEGGKSTSASGVDRKPSVRVRLTPSSRNKDHIQITETKGSRKASLTRRITLPPPGASSLAPDALDRDDADSVMSYASATEESNVSRNPIDIEIEPARRRRRPASPLIPTAAASAATDVHQHQHQQSVYQPPNMSEISAIPTDSFLDGSGPTNLTSRDLESKRSRSPSRGGQLAAGAAGLAAGAVLADKMSNTKPKERPVLPKSADKMKDRDRRPRPSKTRASGLSEKHVEAPRSPRRRSSRGHADSLLSAADSSVLTSSVSPSHTSHKSLDQTSVRSGASKSSINNPKLLETVEDAIRRLILPELSALKREKSRRESRRSSFTSTATSVSRDDLSATERRRSSGRHRERRDREARHDYVHSPYGDEGVDSVVSVDDLSYHEGLDETPRKSHGAGKAAAAVAGAAATGGLTAAALNSRSPASDDRRQRRRRRADGSVRSRSLGRDRYDEEFEDEEEAPAPPMPLLASELNPSELTRTSILSADTDMDRPHSAMDEGTRIHEVSRGSLASPSPAVAAVPATLQQSLGTRHANISHGDLKELSRERDSELSSDSRVEAFQRQPQYHHDDYDDEEYDTRRNMSERDDYEPADGLAPDYYNTQDVPPPLKYVPYQPERRGLSPIYSVSGYTEGGSEAAGPRDSRTINGSPSYDRLQGGRLTPGSAPSNIMSRGFDEQSLDDRSVRSAGQDYRTAGYVDGSDLERVDSEQGARDMGTSPRIVHVPAGVESNVASLVDGSMLDQSVLTGGGSAVSGMSGLSGNEYDVRDSTLSYDERPRDLHTPDARGASPDKLSVRSQQDYLDERDGSRTPTSSRHSRSFAGEYDLDEYGRKVVPTRYRNSPSTSRHSPTASEKAIALGAVGAAAAALKAAKDRSQQPTVEEEEEEDQQDLTPDFVPEGVSRNKSFKQRTMEGREPANTPAHSIDRFELEDRPKMGVSAMPALNDPMPEIGYVDDDLETNQSLARDEMNRTPRGNENWTVEDAENESYPQPESQSKSMNPGAGLAVAGAVAAATAAAMAHSRQPSHEPEDEWQRTSTERKRDTLITNPYDGASPVANPDLLGTRDLEPGTYGANYHTGSPAGQKNLDEGYISQGPVQSPNIQPKATAVLPFAETIEEDPFYVPKGHARHLSGMSQGMGSPIYDAASGGGIDRIESKDIIALMQHLMVRDAQRSARDTEILVTLVRSAAEMRNSFEEMKQILANTEDVIIKEVQENTEDTVKNIIGGPRPYPGSTPRSVKGLSAASQSQDGTVVEDKAKKNSLFKRAFFKSFGAKDTNDLSRIEDMLNQLLAEVEVLKTQSSRPPASRGHSTPRPQSFDNLQPEGQYEQDRGYEPEGHAGTSTASHASQSGQLSLPQSRGPSTKVGYEPNRISTVHEDNEEDYDMPDYRPQSGMLTPGARDVHRGSSVPLDTPPQSAPAQNMSFSSENTPKTDKGKKHKSRGSSSWFPKISRWSESTATSVGKALRGSGMSSKRGGQDDDFGQRPPSRSGSDLAQYEQRQQQQYDNDPYGDDHLHTGFSQTNLGSPAQATVSAPPPPATYMTPEDPKYKAHRNSLNLQHPQPRPGQTERFKAALESQAHEYDTPMSPKSADWAGSATSLQRFPAQAGNNRYSGGSGATGGEYWGSSPAAGPPRPPKEPIDNEPGSPVRSNRVSKLQKNSPLPYQSVESGYATGPGTQASNYTGSPKLENRNLSGALGVPMRRPSGPRAMTPRSAEEEAAREDRRRKRDTFGTVASNETDTF